MSDEEPTTFDERVNEIRGIGRDRQPGDVPIDSGLKLDESVINEQAPLGESTIGGDIFSDRPQSRQSPHVVLVCTDCEVFYDRDEEWEDCPLCANDLLEVQRQ